MQFLLYSVPSGSVDGVDTIQKYGTVAKEEGLFQINNPFNRNSLLVEIPYSCYDWFRMVN